MNLAADQLVPQLVDPDGSDPPLFYSPANGHMRHASQRDGLGVGGPRVGGHRSGRPRRRQAAG